MRYIHPNEAEKIVLLSENPDLKHKAFDSYFGGKEAEGVYQTIISQIPEHDTFIELMGGNYAISRYLNEEGKKWVNDIDNAAYSAYLDTVHFHMPNYTFSNLNYASILAYVEAHKKEMGRVVIYCDPPYRMTSRKSDAKRYNHEWTDADHKKFLKAILIFNHKHPEIQILVSHYPDELYDKVFAKWRTIQFWATTRHGQALENLYMSYPFSPKLQDYRYIGENFWKRQNYDRKEVRWINKLAQLPAIARNRLIKTINQTPFDTMDEVRLFDYKEAREIAERVQIELRPFCEFCMIAGSVRRKKREVKDIEIVCVPAMEFDLFSQTSATRNAGFVSTIKRLGVIDKGNPHDGRYVKIALPEGIALDLFITNTSDLYRQFAMRTGSAEFSHRILAAAWVRDGWIGTPDGLRLRSECVLNGDGKFRSVAVEKPTLPPAWKSEQELFEWLGISWAKYGDPFYRKINQGF